MLLLVYNLSHKRDCWSVHGAPQNLDVRNLLLAALQLARVTTLEFQGDMVGGVEGLFSSLSPRMSGSGAAARSGQVKAPGII